MNRSLLTLSLGLWLSLTPLGHTSITHAQDAPVQEPPETLLEFWLQYQRESSPAPDWAYVFFKKHHPDSSFTERRLMAELEGLVSALRVASQREQAPAVQAWLRVLRRHPPLRTPGRADPAWLAAHLRHVPHLTSLERIGVCQPPTWVEIWSLNGVERVTWRNGMTSDDITAELPPKIRKAQAHAVLISPLGERHRLGIAPWNHEVRPVAPGSRLWLTLPQPLLPSHDIELHWVNKTMPEALATRLPADDCTTLWPNGADDSLL